MAGLTASYINNKLSAEGTTNKTKDLILEFLNTAPSAATIAGTEPKEGPVFDDPEEGYGDQIRDYDIGKTVAQRIINKRNTLGGFTNLSQLAGISRFGQDKFNDLLYSFSKRVTQISTVRFNFHSWVHHKRCVKHPQKFFHNGAFPGMDKGGLIRLQRFAGRLRHQRNPRKYPLYSGLF